MKETFGGKDNTADDTASFDGTFFWYWQLAEGVFHIGIVLGGLSICFLRRGRKRFNLGKRLLLEYGRQGSRNRLELPFFSCIKWPSVPTISAGAWTIESEVRGMMEQPTESESQHLGG